MCVFIACRQRRTYVDNLKCSPVLTCNAMMYNYATGKRVGTIHFVWKIPEAVTAEALSSGNSSALHKIEPSLPLFHTRVMRRQFFEEMKLFNAAKPAVFREMYRRLTGETCLYNNHHVLYLVSCGLEFMCTVSL